MERLLRELAEQMLPYNTNCPQKQRHIDWKRERLIKKIKELAQQINETDNSDRE